MKPLTPAPVRRLLDVPIHALTMEAVLDIADAAIARRERLAIGVVNAAKLVNMRRDPVLREAVLAADPILADGMAVVWACRLLGQRLPERVAGIDLMDRLLARGNEHGYRVYFLGATDEVLVATLEQVRARYPRVQIAGFRNGYFGDELEAEIAADIRRSGADILFLGITSPKKERFLARWSATMNVPVCHGVGGAFDVMAGKVHRAPRLWQRCGLEWFYRVLQEPRRMWKRYLVTNTLFVGMVLSEWARGGRLTRG